MASRATPTPLDGTKFSQERPHGLPSPTAHQHHRAPSSSTYPKPPRPNQSSRASDPQSQTLFQAAPAPVPGQQDGQYVGSFGEGDDDGFEGLDETLISCMTHLSVCSLPPLPYSIPGPSKPSGEVDDGDGLQGEEKGQGGKRGGGPVRTRFPPPPKPQPSSTLGTREEQRRIYLGPKLSDRATGGPDAGPLIERFSCLFKDQYHCKLNPKGIVSLGVAENFLMEKECLELFSHALKTNFLSTDLSYGDSLWGSRRITRALSGFYNEWFNPVEEVLPEQIITGVGCSAVLDQLFYTLMDEGEAILLAAPYYSGFDRDLIPRGRVRLVPVHIPDPESDEAFSPASLKHFDAALKECAEQGIIVRAVIVCNPQNPLGRTYPRETLLAYAKFCEEKDLHLVSDEIYAMSVYDNDYFKHAVPFTSMMSLDVENELGMEFDRARLHVVHGMSKDFCANGLRVGALISQHNPLLLRAMAGTSMLMKISSPADVIWSSLLNDREGLREFVTTNRARLSEAQGFIRGWFESRGIEVANSNAGHFIWINLGGKFGFNDPVTEKKVFQRLLDGGVYIAPGTAYHSHKAGWYRVTFSVARENLEVGLGKMERILGLESVAKV